MILTVPETYLHDFEGEPFVTLTFDGRPCWVARHVGARLGYSHEGKRLPSKILRDWADEFVPGQDYVLLRGHALREFNQALAAADLAAPPAGRGSLVLLFESGLHLVLAKTDLPVGKRLRRFLVDQVLPQIARTGRFEPSSEQDATTVEVVVEAGGGQAVVRSLAERREERLRMQAETRARWVDLCDRRLKVWTLHRMVDAIGCLLVDEARAAVEVLAAEIATGIPVGDLLLDDDDRLAA